MNILRICAILVLTGASASAGLVLQPTVATTDMGSASAVFPINQVRNQSGLSQSYTSGVTDFDAYIASNPTHNSGFANAVWLSATGTTTGNVDFDLGGAHNIESLAFWNRPGSGFTLNVRDFTLLADDNAAFLSPTVLGSFTAAPSTPSSPNFTAIPAEIFPFSPTSASFVRMQITSNYGASNGTGFGEVAFEVTAIPEPSAFALLSLFALVVIGSYQGLPNKRCRTMP